MDGLLTRAVRMEVFLIYGGDHLLDGALIPFVEFAMLLLDIINVIIVSLWEIMRLFFFCQF